MLHFKRIVECFGLIVLTVVGPVPQGAPDWYLRRKDLFAVKRINEDDQLPLKALAAARKIFRLLQAARVTRQAHSHGKLLTKMDKNTNNTYMSPRGMLLLRSAEKD